MLLVVCVWGRSGLWPIVSDGGGGGRVFFFFSYYGFGRMFLLGFPKG